MTALPGILAGAPRDLAHELAGEYAFLLSRPVAREEIEALYREAQHQGVSWEAVLTAFREAYC